MFGVATAVVYTVQAVCSSWHLKSLIAEPGDTAMQLVPFSLRVVNILFATYCIASMSSAL